MAKKTRESKPRIKPAPKPKPKPKPKKGGATTQDDGPGGQHPPKPSKP